MHTEGMVTVTPHGPDADTFVDGQRVTETTVLRSGSTLQFGSAHVFKFVDPMFDQGGKREPAAIMRSRHKSGWAGAEMCLCPCLSGCKASSSLCSLFPSTISSSSFSFLVFLLCLFILPTHYFLKFVKRKRRREVCFVEEGRRRWGLGLAGRARDEGKEKGEEGRLGLGRWREWRK